MAIWDRFFGSSVSTAVGYGMGSALGPALNPVTQQVANEAWQRWPDRPLAAPLVAALVAERKWTPEAGRAEALLTGVNNGRFDRMVTAARGVPDLADLLVLRRRNFITDADLSDALGAAGLQGTWLGPVQKLVNVLASPSDVIRWAVREAFNPPLAQSLGYDQEFPESFADYAAQLGIPRADAERHWIAHWELPSYEQASEMLHRKIISPELFADLLKAKDYPLPWRDRLQQLAQRIPPISDLIRFSVREVYQDATAAKYGYDDDYPTAFTADAALHGMAAPRARQYWRAHWRLPSAQQGYRMLHREQIDEGELDDLLRVQDYPSFWRKRLASIAYLVPGRVDLRRLFIADKISRAETKRGYRRLGYREPDAELLTQLAEALKGEADAAGVGSHVSRARSQLWTTAHRSYLAGELTATLARNKLAQIGVPVAERDAIITLWDHERELVRKTLTPAQIKKAWVKVVKNQTTGQPWTRDDAIGALVTLGYSVNDANEYLDIPPTQTP